MVMRMGLDFVPGVTLASVEHLSDHEVVFVSDTGDLKWRMHHRQDCCESVELVEIVGDINDLVGSPVLQAEVVTNRDNPPDSKYGPPESFTWTFYKFATHKGRVVFRWLGQSNGYYSEEVEFESF